MRNDKGQFIQGNPGKPPGAKHNSTLLKETLVASVSDNDIIDLVDKLKQKAINEGCIQSIKLLFEYTLGKPSQMIINQNYEHNTNEQVSFNDIIKAVRTNGGNL